MATAVNKSSLQTDSIWIDAYKSVTNQLDTYPNNIDLIDFDGIGENKIVVGEFSGQLSIYKGATIDWQTQLPEEINAVGQFLMSVGKSSRLAADQSRLRSSAWPTGGTSTCSSRRRSTTASLCT